ncbi:MAG: chorismate synthase [Bacteroidales bacterium]|nr:chorismate synthase [Bacteroidales bacterium]
MNTFGRIFRVSLFGESHGEEIGVTLDGVEPGIALCEKDFEADIARRRSGAKGTTPRIEADVPRILSGVYDGYTTGAPLTIVFRNTNTRSGDYAKLKDVPRPGHADFTANVKYGGFQDPRGGGHFSGRLTLPIVAAGVVAKKILGETVAEETHGHVQFRCEARLTEIGGIADRVRWEAALAQAQQEGDSLGGIVECVVDGLPAGLGEPFWDSVESCLSHALFAIPGVRGVEFGDGFAAARMKGSEHNDCFTPSGIDGHEGLVTPVTNHAGGVNGGITNGNPLVFRVAFKPTSSIAKAQRTYDFAAQEMTDLRVPGRHDTCFALRTPVIVEAMAAIVLADLIDRA